MSLVLYSGGDFLDNELLNSRAIELTGKRSPKITYIPASSEYGLEDFRDFVDAVDTIKRCQYVYFPIDYPFTEEMRLRAFESDIIFLSGGNTYYFLHHLREQGLLEDLIEAHENGCVLAGLSAGAILLSPNISTAGFPDFDKDENFIGLKARKALGLCEFEFFPHYTHSRRYSQALKQHSLKSKFPVFAAPDESGIVVRESSIELIGPMYLFTKGVTSCLQKESKRWKTQKQSTFVERRNYPRYTFF